MPKKVGKPPYQPTAADRATVQNLAALGATHADICRCLGESGISEKTMRKHFRQELEASLGQVKALAMSQVVNAIKAGAPWAVCFFLKCRGGWSETAAHRFVDKNGNDRNGALTLDELDRMRQEAGAE